MPLCAVVLGALISAAASLRVHVYNSTTVAGAVLNDAIVEAVGLDALPEEGPFTAVFTGTMEAPEGSEYTFIMEADAGWMRLWVDDHLLIDDGFDAPAATTETFAARYAVPVPFFPGATGSRVRLEFTVASGAKLSRLALLAKSSGTVEGPTFTSDVPAAELRYFEERAAAEAGWNTWLSEDMLTHALLPHGLGLSLSFHAGSAVLAGLGAEGPSCDRGAFPATHGLHDVRGEYTEIESLDFAGASYKIESATTAAGELLVLVTRLTSEGSPAELHLDASVPATWKPRRCAVQGGDAVLRAECHGLPAVSLQAAAGTEVQATSTGFAVSLPAKAGAVVAFATGEGAEAPSTQAVVAAVAAARAKLVQRIEAFGEHNETFAGMVTAISWNVVYTPLEGIITPIFRGSPWFVSKPHNYVLFEWDTYFAAMIATYTDEWVAKSNIIRMSKSLIYKGFVAGFWNGKCGETDKSKPPVGGLALQRLVGVQGKNLWVAELLMDQLVMWNRWWSKARLKNGMIAPGSTREMLDDPTYCAKEDALSASRDETGLDNSPLYTGTGYEAKFIAEEDVIDSADVGMTALYARDCTALATLARALGRSDDEKELTERALRLQEVLNERMWNEDEQIYLNKMWQTDEWIPMGTTGSAIVAPTSFYPMMTGTPTDEQVRSMIGRWLSNETEFCVTAACEHGLPSISRSSPAFHDNDYWRGRAWAPMNWLIYLGLREYSHLDSAVEARRSLAAQSQATFLVEWRKNHRVMENFNSQSGAGCDVQNASPFYHWGALNALIPLLEAGLLDGARLEGELLV